jgi:hypothetical protein
MDRANAKYIKEKNEYDKCEGYSEMCILSDSFPQFCPINDNLIADCAHLRRGDELSI